LWRVGAAIPGDPGNRTAADVDLFRRHRWTGPLLLVGPLIAIGSLLLHAYVLKEMGVPIEVWAAVGLGIFFLGVIGILMKWEREHKPAIAGPPIAAPSPLSTSGPASPGAHGSRAARAFLDMAPEELRELVKGRTIHERDRITKPFIGKWMDISVIIDDAVSGDDEGTIWGDEVELSEQIISDEITINQIPSVVLHFSRQWNDRIDSLQKGQNISVIGKIERITQDYIELRDCELH
jgi:hypothetical protein